MLALVGSARADVGETIILRCTHGQSLSGFSQARYRQALKELSADSKSTADAGADPPGPAGRGRGGGHGGGGATSAAAPAAIASTPAEQQRARSTPEGAGAGPVSVGGQVVRPGVVHADVASALSSLPTPLLAVLAFLLACLLAARRRAHPQPCPCPPLRLSQRRRRARRAAPAPVQRAPVTRTPRTRRRCAAIRGLWWPTLLIAGACLLGHLLRQGRAEPRIDDHDRDGADARRGPGGRGRGAARAAPARAATGPWPLGLLLAFTALTALSVVWSVQPDDELAGRRADARLQRRVRGGASRSCAWRPMRWPALLGGITLAAVVVCAYALLTKVFPAQLAATDTYARLQEPFGYWNAIGLTAAMGVIGCMWLGAAARARAAAARSPTRRCGLLLLTLLLAYSRGALAALAVGAVLWFCVVPLRLRGAAVLLVGGARRRARWRRGTSPGTRSAPKASRSPQRSAAGHRARRAAAGDARSCSTLVGLAIGFLTARQRAVACDAPARGRGAVAALVAGRDRARRGALAHSHRGLTGSISHAFSSLTNPNAKPPPNTPGRLTAVASVRARYWKEALQVFDAHPALGAGAEGYATARLRYRKETLDVAHAHGFVVQTLADLGIVGLLLALALLLRGWRRRRATHPFNRRWTSWRRG